MKRLIISLIALCCFVNAQGQKVTRTYDNVSLSEALRDLNEQSRDYTISFMYNELEDFRVTTSIKHKSFTDALMQIIGFYPIRVVKRGEHDIYVECTRKTERHLSGTIIDENRQPVPYANIYLLHPSDSTVIGGGVSNEAGVFVIPYELPVVLAR
ncbi:MAG: carboxypeptidase regulatory-like domain-containing protein, partial [Prevotella sp.]|nr:carboxypeptidase regulatory-like domain-containing protein [Prevotella sp.]